MHWVYYLLIPVVPYVLYKLFQPSPPSRSWKNIEYPKCNFVQLNEKTWLVSVLAEPLPKNMVVYKINDTDLWLHSVIAMNPDDMTKLETLGTPKVMVVPNSQHRLDAALYKERYPELIVTTPSFSQKSTEDRVKMDMTIEDWAKDRKDVIVHRAKGTGQFELAYELRYDGDQKAVLVFCDQIFNLKHLEGFRGIVLKFIGSTGFFGVSGIGNLMLKALGNKAEFRQWLIDVPKLIPGLSQIVVAHGEPVVDELDKKLKEATDYLA